MVEARGQTDLILASGSRFRRRMLEQAGLDFLVVVADVDEPALRQALVTGNPEVEAAVVAAALARAKAEQISARYPEALVIGADQVLAHRGRILGKPKTVMAARRQLESLRGSAHRLPTAVVLARGGQTVWSHVETPALTVRAFTDGFLDQYLDCEGLAVLETAGGYKLEGFGGQLFEAIEGDYFSIIGLPLLALLGELRTRGVLIS